MQTAECVGRTTSSRSATPPKSTRRTPLEVATPSTKTVSPSVLVSELTVSAHLSALSPARMARSSPPSSVTSSNALSMLKAPTQPAPTKAFRSTLFPDFALLLILPFHSSAHCLHQYGGCFIDGPSQTVLTEPHNSDE